MAAEFETLLDERHLSLAIDLPDQPVQVDFDADRIQQVLHNLLGNAVKVSPPSSTIRLFLQRQNASVVVKLEDLGPGIPENELDTVFDKFVQSSKIKTGAGGTGLGLAICRQIVSAHHGRIWAENQPKGGTVLCFELPLSEQPAETSFSTP